jgi:hypothetical protein
MDQKYKNALKMIGQIVMPFLKKRPNCDAPLPKERAADLFFWIFSIRRF